MPDIEDVTRDDLGNATTTTNGQQGLMDSLLRLPACALFPTGRTGSDLLQSMLDSHPDVLTFNGHLMFHAFWNSATCVAAGAFAPEDLLDEFIGKHIELFKSRYDILERKHQLGDGFDESIDIDLHRFRKEVLSLLADREVDSRSMLLAIYGAYALCLGQDLGKKKIFFHHPHDFTELHPYLSDFPDSKIICMTRDPRANFVSGIEHHRDHNHVSDFDNGGHLYYYINRILKDATPLESCGNEYRVIRIEDLGEETTLRSLCAWLHIANHPCLKESTWAGLRWHSDKLSKVNRDPGFSKTMLENQWETRLSFLDKYVLNYIMYPRLLNYGYTHRKIGILGALSVPILLLLPLSYEFRFMTPEYIRNTIRKGQRKELVRNGINYARRIFLFLKFYLRVTGKRKFNQPLLRAEPAATIAPSLKES